MLIVRLAAAKGSVSLVGTIETCPQAASVASAASCPAPKGMPSQLNCSTTIWTHDIAIRPNDLMNAIDVSIWQSARAAASH